MKTLITVMFILFSFYNYGQIETTNAFDNAKLTVFILPQNVIPKGKIISYGPPDPKARGRSLLLNFDNGIYYIIKVKTHSGEDGIREKIKEVYKIINGVSTSLEHHLNINIGPSSDDQNLKPCRIFGTIESGEEWDISMNIYQNHDLKNSYFLDFIKEKDMKVILDMKQK